MSHLIWQGKQVTCKMWFWWKENVSWQPRTLITCFRSSIAMRSKFDDLHWSLHEILDDSHIYVLNDKITEFSVKFYDDAVILRRHPLWTKYFCNWMPSYVIRATEMYSCKVGFVKISFSMVKLHKVFKCILFGQTVDGAMVPTLWSLLLGVCIQFYDVLTDIFTAVLIPRSVV